MIATRAALRLADYVVTEAGFGADLGAEEFVDIKCRKSCLATDAAVVVPTVRALKFHGGVDATELGREDIGAVERGMENLARHLRNVREVYGIPVVGRAQRIPARYSDAEVAKVRRARRPGARGSCRKSGYSLRRWRHRGDTDLRRKVVLDLIEGSDPSTFRVTYPDDVSLKEKAEHSHTGFTVRPS